MPLKSKKRSNIKKAERVAGEGRRYGWTLFRINMLVLNTHLPADSARNVLDQNSVVSPSGGSIPKNGKQTETLKTYTENLNSLKNSGTSRSPQGRNKREREGEEG